LRRRSEGIASNSSKEPMSSVSSKQLPTPKWLVAVRSPPSMRARRRETLSPRPVPPKRRVIVVSAW
jgi:hypothetical protein